MTTKLNPLSFSLLLTLVALSSSYAQPSVTNSSAKPGIPYVPTRHDVVRDLLWVAGVGTNDVVYDLGSGDGRVVISAVRDFGARKAVGIEINPQLIQESRSNAVRAGVTEKVQFIHGDLFTSDFSAATVAVLYLGHGANLDLRSKLVRTLKPGARVVSHQFGMGEWTPDKTLDVRTAILGMYSEMHNPFASNSEVPDFTTPFIRMNHDVISTWIVPAPVAGVWKGDATLGGSEGKLTVTLHQRLSGVTGNFQFDGRTNVSGSVQADLWGTHLRFHCIAARAPYGQSSFWFEGNADGDTLKGTLWVSDKQETRSSEWTARREKADFTGTWEWSGPKDSKVQLTIARDEQLSATYLDRNRTVPMYVDATKPINVTDFYDFGGGFYFTLLLGRGDRGDRMTGPENGWLIGEAVATNDSLQGTIAFYPYPDSQFPFASAKTNATNNAQLKTGKRDWHAIRSAQ